MRIGIILWMSLSKNILNYENEMLIILHKIWFLTHNIVQNNSFEFKKRVTISLFTKWVYFEKK